MPQAGAAQRARRMFSRRSRLRLSAVGMHMTREVQPSDVDACVSRTGCLRKTGSASLQAAASISRPRRPRRRANGRSALRNWASSLARSCPLREEGGRARLWTKGSLSPSVGAGLLSKSAYRSGCSGTGLGRYLCNTSNARRSSSTINGANCCSTRCEQRDASTVSHQSFERSKTGDRTSIGASAGNKCGQRSTYSSDHPDVDKTRTL
jgi:hypothetical protein